MLVNIRGAAQRSCAMPREWPCKAMELARRITRADRNDDQGGMDHEAQLDEDAAIVGRRAAAQRVRLWRRVSRRKEKGSRAEAGGLQFAQGRGRMRSAPGLHLGGRCDGQEERQGEAPRLLPREAQSTRQEENLTTVRIC